MNLSDFKIVFDKILSKYVNNKIKEAKKLLNDKKLNKYIEYIQTFIFSGGKRIRPYGLRITYKGFGGKNEKAILNFGIMFELFHTMALIHDDIIDQSKKRHNILTMHQYINTLLDKPDNHLAQGQAILIGDLLISRVYELGYKHHDFAENLLFQARKNVHQMIEEVILGQMIDVNMMNGIQAHPKMIEKKNMYKTASYTFTRPMLTGAILAGANQEAQKLIITLGNNLGLAFQVRDDLFDILGADQTKSPFMDIQEGQQTYFTNYIFEKGTKEQKKLLKSCFKKKLNNQEIKKLKKMFDDSGALEYGKQLIKKYAEIAENTLKKIKFKDLNAKNEIQILIQKISDLKI